ncbi:MAG: hypothetical protein KDC02_16615 [Flavobacteriales bacterium]|nr:hypothetical protein [Flavobacteriales bacterium]
MRWNMLVSLLLVVGVVYAGEPDLVFVLVRNEKGRPLHGAYAPHVSHKAWLGRRNRPAFTVELHFTVSEEYPYDEGERGRHMSWSLTPDTVRVGWRRHLRFRVLDCYCTEPYLLVRRGEETMRLDLPDDPEERAALVARMELRGAEGPPEVVRFRPGRYTLLELSEGFEALEERIARRMGR